MASSASGAHTLTRKTQLAKTSRTRHHVAALRIGSNHVHDVRTFHGGEKILRGRQVGGRFNNRMHLFLDANGHLWSSPKSVQWRITASAGSAQSVVTPITDAITNGLIHSDSLEINTVMTRLQYAGTVDTRANVNARVTAQLLHNLWVVGPIISPFLWPVSKLFEYKITGTLQNPKKEPVVPFVPKLLEMPLHPIRSLEGVDPRRRQFLQFHQCAAAGM